MSYLALYRKYRPTNFSSIVGQDVIVDILKNSIIIVFYESTSSLDYYSEFKFQQIIVK